MLQGQPQGFFVRFFPDIIDESQKQEVFRHVF
jgi:hypothetical protein